MRLRSFIPAVVLTVPLWGQAKAPSAAEAAQQIGQIRAKLQGKLDSGDREADVARREEDFDRTKEIVSSFVIARVEASPDLNALDLRDSLIQVLGANHDKGLGPDSFHQPPYIFRIEPPYLSNRPVVFAVVYDGDIYPGAGGARIVVESYAL